MNNQSSFNYMIFEESNGQVSNVPNTEIVTKSREYFQRQEQRPIYNISESVDEWGTIHLWDIEKPENWCKIYFPLSPYAPKVTE